jgi:class 3 adenylate cyclase
MPRYKLLQWPGMREERAQRRFAAILAADVVGYSRLMERDEAGTLATLRSPRKEVLEPMVGRHLWKFQPGAVPT